MRRQPQARTTKAKSRIDKFYDIKEDAHKKRDENQVTLEIDMARLGGKILEAHNISKSFDDLKIIENFSYKFKKGERVGVAGPNGVGKTTFIKLLTKELQVDAGKVVIGDTVVFGHYTQELSHLNQDIRLIDSVREIAEYIPLKKGRKLTAESLLERFLFPIWTCYMFDYRNRQRRSCSSLGGTEKSYVSTSSTTPSRSQIRQVQFGINGGASGTPCLVAKDDGNIRRCNHPFGNQ